MRKIKKTKVVCKWEVLSTFKDVEENFGSNKDIPANETDFFKRNFKGNYIELLNQFRIEPQQKWSVNIKTKIQLDDGQVGWHEMEFEPDALMSLNELLKGNEDVKQNIGHGVKVRWRGITNMWIDELEKDLPDSTCLEAWVTATCYAKVKGLETNNLIQKLLAS